jgi:hypothetical protein
MALAYVIALCIRIWCPLGSVESSVLHGSPSGKERELIVAGLVVSSVGFVLTFIGVGFATYQARSAKDLAKRATDLLAQVKELDESQSRTAKVVGEISIIDAYLSREFSRGAPDTNVVERQYGALLTRALLLVGGEDELQAMVGELR